MIDKFDYQKNLDFLINTKTNTTKIEKQTKVLNSTKYNHTFEIIEESLNLLYEKTRTLQNIMNYSNSLIKSEIDNSINECRTLLSNIESNRDLIKDSAYINYNVDLQSIFDTYSDRDNSPIKGVQFHNGAITLNNNTVENIIIKNMLVENKDYNNNIYNTSNNILNDSNYRTFYMFDRPQKSYIKERLVIHLEKNKVINKINLTPSNCEVESIEYIHEDGHIEVVNGYKVNVLKNRDVKAIAINIKCKNYISSHIKYNESIKNNFWEDIKNEIKDNSRPKYYYYLFGLDKISIQFVELYNKSCFISKDIKIEKLKNNEYISLVSEYSSENSNIEFYIIDGTNEIPIIPENESQIIHEQIFYKIPTRFTIDNSKDIKIYKDNIPSKVSLGEAINSEDEGYSISYTPKNANSINRTLNDTIKIKAIIRNYSKDNIPFIKSIKIKKYGGGALWIDQK